MRLKVDACGKPQFKRYFLVNDRKRYWTGKGWARDFRKCMLFHDWNLISEEYKWLEEAMQKGKEIRTFQATIDLKVWADKGFTVEQLRNWMYRAVCILLNHEEHGTGPVPDSTVQVHIDWGTLREILLRPEPGKKSGEKS